MVLFSLGLSALASQVEQVSPAGFWGMLNVPEAKIQPDKAGTSAIVMFAGLSYSFYLLVEKGGVAGVSARVAFAPSRKISAALLAMWLNRRADWRGEVDLDGTVRLDASFANAAASDCTGFLWSVRQMADQFGGKPPTGWAKIDEGTKVDCLTENDVFALAKQWGWEYKGGYGGSGPTWAAPMKVHGQLVFVSPSHPGHPEPWRLLLRATVERPTGMDDAAWKGYSGKKREGITSDLQTDRSIRFYTLVDLRGGVALRSLKKSIESFVEKFRPRM